MAEIAPNLSRRTVLAFAASLVCTPTFTPRPCLLWIDVRNHLFLVSDPTARAAWLSPLELFTADWFESMTAGHKEQAFTWADAWHPRELSAEGLRWARMFENATASERKALWSMLLEVLHA